jgi:hypothetical protein
MSRGVVVTGRVVSAFRSTLRDNRAAVCVIVRPSADRSGKVHALVPMAGAGIESIVAADKLVTLVHAHRNVQLQGSALESWFDHGVDVRLLDATLHDAAGRTLLQPGLAEVEA